MRPARTVLEQKIRERRMTLEEFAEYVELFAREHNEPGTLGLRHLKRLIAGRRPDGQPLSPLRPATARLLEHIFGISVNELLGPQSAPPEPDSTAELSQMLHASSRVDKPMVTLFREQLSNIRRTDRQLGAIVTHEEVRTKAAQVGRLLTYSLAAETRQPLAALLSDLHTLAGWQSLDLGRLTESWQHYEDAKSAAQESGSVPFEVHAAGEQAFVLLDAGESSTAVGLLESMCERSKQKCPSLLRAWLVASYGEALAEDGKWTESLRAFDKAAGLLEADSTDSGGPYIVLDSTHLDRWRGHTLATFADNQAIHVLTQALDKLDATFTRAETALRVDLATAFLSSRSPEQAGTHIKHAAHLANQIGSVRQQRRIEYLRIRQQGTFFQHSTDARI